MRDCSLGSAREDTNPDASLEPRGALAFERGGGVFYVRRLTGTGPGEAGASGGEDGSPLSAHPEANLRGTATLSGRLSRAGLQPQRRSDPRREGRLRHKGLKRSGFSDPPRTRRSAMETAGGFAETRRFPRYPQSTPRDPEGPHGNPEVPMGAGGIPPRPRRTRWDAEGSRSFRSPEDSEEASSSNRAAAPAQGEGRTSLEGQGH